MAAVLLAASVAAAAPVSKAMAVSAEEIVYSDTAPSGICFGSNGQLYFTDADHHVIYQQTGSGVKIEAGSASGKSGYVDGKVSEALFSSPWDMVIYKEGFAVSDTGNNVVRLLKNGMVKTLAGNGNVGFADRKGKKASFCRPTGLATGKNGKLFIADTGNNCIRVMKKNGMVKTFAGSSDQGCADGRLKKARFNEPTGLYYSYSTDTLYVADSGNHRICKIKNGKVKTIAGSARGEEGNELGKAKKSRFSNPQGIFYSNNALYIADTGNSCIKKLQNGTVTKSVTEYSLQDGLLPSAPRSLCMENGYLYIGDIYADQLIKVKM